ncbi:hypothetical protein ROZALSC1DRAFT_22412 [Rozella allomycis CSF55]|uniref:Uncharacterized protein n=1 Tax=Rozella allomycis (strain CSF55) TaxID=988480 RepID=A0A4P9YIA1_ROZAC|nr:hypothetical protein ROZALSC1DRAFT_22412 [Rozella allomycis CSF55]
MNKKLALFDTRKKEINNELGVMTGRVEINTNSIEIIHSNGAIVTAMPTFNNLNSDLNPSRIESIKFSVQKNGTKIKLLSFLALALAALIFLSQNIDSTLIYLNEMKEVFVQSVHLDFHMIFSTVISTIKFPIIPYLIISCFLNFLFLSKKLKTERADVIPIIIRSFDVVNYFKETDIIPVQTSTPFGCLIFEPIVPLYNCMPLSVIDPSPFTLKHSPVALQFSHHYSIAENSLDAHQFTRSTSFTSLMTQLTESLANFHQQNEYVPAVINSAKK